MERMKASRFSLPSGVMLALLTLPCTQFISPAVTNTVFATQFEAAEGYDSTYELVGQNGWLGDGSGGNGLVTNLIAGQGQQAYIGYYPPATNDDFLIVWKPVDYYPLASNTPVVRFSVLMSIVDSSTTNYDDFFWSVYNAQGHRLFTLDFDNYELAVFCALDDANGFVATGVLFTSDVDYTLLVTMNFASNLWSATLNDMLLATNKPISTTGAALTLGDVDAVWAVYDPNAPGDNFMLFDNYRITAESVLPPAPRLELLARAAGQTSLRLWGQENARYAIEATTNLTQWTPFKTNVVTGGSFDYVDTSSSGLTRRAYRARFVP